MIKQETIDRSASLSEFIREVETGKNSISAENESLLFIGNTGVGKSTLIQFLMQNKYLESVKHKGLMVIKEKVPAGVEESRFRISCQNVSETSLPYAENYEGVSYRDLPGFNDNRNDSIIDQEVVNSIYLNEVFHKTKKFKIVLVASQSTLTQRNNGFDQLFDHFTSMFAAGLEALENSCVLVITKCIQPFELEDAIQRLNQFIEMPKFSQEKKSFLSHLIENKKVALFYTPVKAGPLDFGCSAQIHEVIKSADFCQSVNFTANISDSSKQKLLSTSNYFNSSVTDWIHSKSSRSKSSVFSGIELKSSGVIVEKYRQIKKIAAKKMLPVDFIAHLKDLFCCESDLQQLEEKIEWLNFIDQVYPKHRFEDNPFKFDVQSWASALKQVKFKLSDACYVEVIDDELGLLIKKADLSVQQISQWVDKYKSQFVMSFVILVANEIKLEKDVNFYGMNVMVYSQSIVTPPERKIEFRLKGANARDYNFREYLLNAKDTDGSPGSPGESGGSLYLSVNHLQGKGIVVNLSGGQGGKGQSVDYSDSSDLITKIKRDAQKGQFHFLSNRVNYNFGDKEGTQKLTAVLKSIATFNGQCLQTYRSDTIWAFNNLYKLNPGVGGKGGSPGQFYSFKNFDSIDIIRERGDAGEHGEMKIDIFEGKYVRELMFSAMRKDGKVMDEQVLGEILTKETLNGAVLLGTQVTCTKFAQNATQQAIGTAASQAALEATEQAALKGLTNGVMGLGVGLAIQAGISAISAGISDYWKEQVKRIDTKYFPSAHTNHTNVLEPRAKKIRNFELLEVEYQSELTKIMNTETYRPV